MKLIHNELPTLDKLRTRWSDLYGPDTTCPLCNEEDETREHIFKYKGLESQINQVWKKAMEKIFKEMGKFLLGKKGKTNIKKMTNLEEKQTADFIKELEERIFRLRQELFNFTIGLIEQKSIKKYKKLMEKLQPKDRSIAMKAKKILVSASNKFQEL